MFCIEIIAILILILFLSKHSLCPRILEQGLLLFYSGTKRMFCIEIIAILILISVLSKHSLFPRILQTGITSILGQRECLNRNNIRIRITIISIQNILFVLE